MLSIKILETLILVPNAFLWGRWFYKRAAIFPGEVSSLFAHADGVFWKYLAAAGLTVLNVLLLAALAILSYGSVIYLWRDWTKKKE